jgi:undecaprenol kinase
MKQEWIRLVKSFSYALSGLKEVIRAERNMQLHLGISGIVILLAVVFRFSRFEWLILLLTIGVMLCLEMVNSAIERVVDLITTDYHPLAEKAKDASAAAVFVFSIISVLVGMLLFANPLLQWIVGILSH